MSAAPELVTNGPGEANAWFRALVEFERDSLPELPAPRDYAEYERVKCVEQGYGMRTIYRGSEDSV